MKNINKKFWKFLESEDGPTAVEYAVMVALIILVAIGAVQFLGGNVSGTFKATSDVLPHPEVGPKKG